MSSTGSFGGGSYSSKNVFPLRYRFKVGWITAPPVPAEMIQLETFWYWTNHHFVGMAMSGHGFPINQETPIPTCILGCPPPPTPWLDMDSSPKHKTSFYFFSGHGLHSKVLLCENSRKHHAAFARFSLSLSASLLGFAERGRPPSFPASAWLRLLMWWMSECP